MPPGVLRGLGAGLLLLTLAACATPRPAVVVPPADRYELVARLQQLAGAYSHLRGLAKVHIVAGDERRSSSQVLLAERPDRFRVEVLAMFGPPLAILVSDGSELSVSLPARGEFYRGPASAENLRRFTRLPLDARDLVSLLLYQPPLLNAGEIRTVVASQGPRLVIESLEGARQEIDFDAQLRVVASRWFDQAGRLQLAANYERFADDSGFPEAMSLQLPDRRIEAEIDFSDLDVQQSIDASLFRLNPPAGQEVKPLP